MRIPLAHSDSASKVQVVVPQSVASKVLEQLQSVSTGGHFGDAKPAGKG